MPRPRIPPIRGAGIFPKSKLEYPKTQNSRARVRSTKGSRTRVRLHLYGEKQRATRGPVAVWVASR